ncbi:MAG: hypothetical protein JWO32_3127, partial [Bacteroidetes bacterium]|nr:hypothetical protein [Bacteroidota bacterium]
TGTLTNFALTGASSNWIAPGGVVTGFSTPTACTQGAALNFDGTNDRVSVPNNASLNFGTGDFTVESYFKSAVAQSNYAGIVVKATGGGNTGFQFVIVGNKLAAEFSDGVTALGVGNGLSGTTTLTDGIWHHVAMIVTRAQNKIELLVDGNVEATVVNGSISTMNINAAVPLFIGTERTNTAFMNGSLDEVRLWNVARTKCQINTFKNCEIASTAAGLVANYHYNQGISSGSNGAETNLADFSGNINTGTLVNFALTGATSNWIAPGSVISGSVTPASLTPTVIASPSSTTICNSQSAVLTGGGASTYTWTGGVVNATAFTPTGTASYTVTGTNASGCTNTAVASVNVNNCTPAAALNFDGVNDFVGIPASASIPIGNLPYTIEAKIKPTVLGVRGIVGWGNYGTVNQVNALRLDPSGNIVNYWWGADLTVSPSPINLVDGNWHHVAATFDGTTRSIYVDGVLKGSDTPGAHAVPNSNNLRIGSTNNGEFFNGGIDETRIWNIARTQCEINMYKDCEIPSTATGLSANYHFNQAFAGVTNTVTSLTDASGNSNTGTLTNFALTGATSNWITPGGVITGSTTPASLTPVVTASPSNTTICNSQSAVLTGGGAATYTWNGGVINATAFTPTATASYTVIGKNASGCTNSAVATVNVNNCTPAAALNFDGVNDFIQIGNVIPTGSSYTKEMWVYANSNGCNNMLSSGDDPFYLSGGKLAAGNSGNYNYVQDANNFPLNAWTHAVVTYDAPSATMNLYVNGVLVATGNSAPAYSGVPTMYIGRHTGGCYFDGTLD